MLKKYNQFVDNLFWSFIFDALTALIAGTLVLIYPNLLGIAVGFFLIVLGLKGLIFAFKVRKNVGLGDMSEFKDIIK